jgi:flavin-dependent dehydrogenase
MTNHLGQQAVVIGGSLAGLMTARVLAEHFDSVVVLERPSWRSSKTGPGT